MRAAFGHEVRQKISFIIKRNVAGQLAAIAEQVVYTSFSLIVFIIAVTKYDLNVSAQNLGLIALSNLPVPFQSIQMGWRKSTETNIWLGSRFFSITLSLITTVSLASYAALNNTEINPPIIAIFITSGIIAVWSNGIRWIYIKKANFLLLLYASFTSLLALLFLELSSLISGSLSLFVSALLAKLIFTLLLLNHSTRHGWLTLLSQPEDFSFDSRSAILATSRFFRTNGIFTIITIISPSSAISGRLIQQAISLCRVIQNPLANYAFFHKKTSYHSTILIQISLGTIVAIGILIGSQFLGISSPPILSFLAVFCATLGFVGLFVLRQANEKNLGIASESLSALLFLLLAITLTNSHGYIIGIILSEGILFFAGLLVLYRMRNI
ncbi:hypothetical protein SAMN05421759_1208 [Roseivivax lentus]|uniref:Uncharacterized protein n=1 Tax=Roseivivax lentus TaxID=633194 RepID=A0A1N7PTM2_9RHOB|nr:hypothetical protein [Roseivivax lentus]SIT13912.1 hypothetical protein SAMN05421759_1208 [Roseivivax lentus]